VIFNPSRPLHEKYKWPPKTGQAVKIKYNSSGIRNGFILKRKNYSKKLKSKVALTGNYDHLNLYSSVSGN